MLSLTNDKQLSYQLDNCHLPVKRFLSSFPVFMIINLRIMICIYNTNFVFILKADKLAEDRYLLMLGINTIWYDYSKFFGHTFNHLSIELGITSVHVFWNIYNHGYQIYCLIYLLIIFHWWAGKKTYVYLALEHVFIMKHLIRTEWN